MAANPHLESVTTHALIDEIVLRHEGECVVVRSNMPGRRSETLEVASDLSALETVGMLVDGMRTALLNAEKLDANAGRVTGKSEESEGV